MKKNKAQPMQEQLKQDAPQIAPVAVISITYAPPLGRVLAIQPQFPLQMSVNDVLTILRAAEQQIIADAVIAQARQNQTDEGK